MYFYSIVHVTQACLSCTHYSPTSSLSMHTAYVCALDAFLWKVFLKPTKQINEKASPNSIFNGIPISILAHANDHFKGLPRLEALIRIANIPIIESGVKTASTVYLNLKVCYIHFKLLIGCNKKNRRQNLIWLLDITVIISRNYTEFSMFFWILAT